MNYASSNKPITFEDFSKICRTCFDDSNLHNINNIIVDGITAIKLLEYSVQIKVEKTDRLPQNLCMDCVKKLHRCYKFQLCCFNNEATLKKLLQGADEATTENEIHYVIEVISDTDDDSLDKSAAEESLIANNISDSIVDCPKEEEIDLKCDNVDLKLSVQEVDEFSTKNQADVTKLNCDLDHKSLEESIANDGSLIEDSPKGKEQVIKVFKKPKIIRQCKQVIVRCSECLLTFETKDMLLEHKKEMKHGERRKYPCSICNKPWPKNKLKEHMITHTKERPFPCETCSRGFTTKQSLRRHFMTHTGERPHVCSVCGKAFIQSGSLQYHEKKHETNPTAFEPNAERSEQGAPMTCSFCGRCFKLASSFEKHVARHNEEFNLSVARRPTQPSQEGRVHICEICSKGYKTKTLLKSHQLRHGERKFLCSDCGKRFYDKSSLALHSRLHTGEKPYTCIVCKRTFAQVVSLDSHMLVHSRYKSFSCKYCSRSFALQHHLKYHLRTHTGEKPYKCTHCGKSFALKWNLTEHIRTHTGEIPFSCDVCGKGFRKSSDMKKHKRQNHEELKDNSGCSPKDQDEDEPTSR